MMKRLIKRAMLIAIFGFMLLGSGFSQNAAQLNCRFQELYLNGDMKTWKVVIDSLRRRPLDSESQIVLLHAEYGWIGNLLGQKKNADAKKEIELFETRLEKAMGQSPNNGTLYALKAALIGFKIGLQTWKAPILGRENNANVKNAIKYGANDALPYFELGNSLHYRPAAVGGNKPEALKNYEKAFALYKKQGGCSWMYFNTGAWLGQIYARQGNTAKAEAMYLQLLREAPHFDWVKNELLPQLRQGKVSNYGNL